MYIDGSFMKNKRIQWHPGFVAAMNLELAQNRNDLIFQKEYNLNTKPLEIDLLIIKKETTADISNEIGKIFRRHNILEYKNPTDQLNIDTFYKTEAYAALYKSYGKTTDEIKADDITISFIRKAKPTALFRYFSKHGIKISNPYTGVYYLEGAVLFPTQIIVTKELDSSEHTWLTALSSHLPKLDIHQLMYKVSHLTDTFDREMAESVLQVTLRANQNLIQQLKEEDTMNEALSETLLEIMEPEISEIKKKSMEQGISEGISQGISQGINQGISQGISKGILQGERIGKVTAYYDMGLSVDEIAQKVHVSADEVIKILSDQ